MGDPTPLNTTQLILNRLDVPCLYQYEFFEEAIKNIGTEGLFIELGLFVGNTAKQICEISKKTLYGFDSFLGLEAEVTPEVLVGMCKCERGLVYHPNVIVVDGRIQDTLPKFCEEHKERVAYVNFDMDSIGDKYGLFELSRQGKLVKGSVISILHVFKLYEGGVYDSIYKAFEEWVNTFNVKFKYLAFGDVHMALQIIEDVKQI